MAHKGPAFTRSDGSEYCYTCGHPLDENVDCYLGAPTPKEKLINKVATDILLEVEAWRGQLFQENDNGTTMRWLTMKLSHFATELEKLRPKELP